MGLSQWDAYKMAGRHVPEEIVKTFFVEGVETGKIMIPICPSSA